MAKFKVGYVSRDSYYKIDRYRQIRKNVYYGEVCKRILRRGILRNADVSYAELSYEQVSYEKGVLRRAILRKVTYERYLTERYLMQVEHVYISNAEDIYRNANWYVQSAKKYLLTSGRYHSGGRYKRSTFPIIVA